MAIRPIQRKICASIEKTSLESRIGYQFSITLKNLKKHEFHFLQAKKLKKHELHFLQAFQDFLSKHQNIFQKACWEENHASIQEYSSREGA